MAEAFRPLAWAPRATLAALALPVAAGLAGTILPGLGWMPALGGERLDLAPWHALLGTPGIARSAGLSLATGLIATLLSLGCVVLIMASLSGTRAFDVVRHAISPILSVPHAAAAFGLAFLIAPSGWIVRALSPWATGWERPPDWLVPGDPMGLTLIAGLATKEIPFLMLMAIAALPQTDAERSLRVALTLGYGRVAAWVACVFPRIYAQIRLPVYAVLAYSLSNVETALILGPSTPPTLAVRLTAWMRDPDLAVWLKASAGATLQLVLVLVAFALWVAGERAAILIGRRWILRGGRAPRDGLARGFGVVMAGMVSLPVFLGLAGLAIWSVAGFWRFPDLLPGSFTLTGWTRAGPDLLDLAATTILIAGGAVVAGLTLVLACLEHGARSGARPGTAALLLLYLPLLIPQISFLFGLQILGLWSGFDGTLWAVIFAHGVFVLPYLYLSLADPWDALDPRLAVAAATLGAGPNRVFWRVRLPMMLGPILTAGAVGLAVSIGLYLPTLLVGAGRVPTLTTEAVALAAGGDRRLIGVYALLQAALPFLGFALALGLPALIWRNRRAMRAGW
ncbi:ABC transporter permease [Amaricoccus macauensis]|uniref:ABC transporter permease n=1 Tax=Amaricoccus macauensis TaxID=57001 RepID=UPI003C7DCD19